MKKIYFGVFILFITLTGCKKQAVAPVVLPTNLEVTVTNTGTFDLKIYRRVYTTNVLSLIVDTTNVPEKYDIKMNGYTNDMYYIEANNGSTSDIDISVIYNGSSLGNWNLGSNDLQEDVQLP